MVKYFRLVSGRLLFASVFAVHVAGGGAGLVTLPQAVAGPTDTAAWMASEAQRLVSAQYKPDGVVITQSDLAHLVVRGTWSRRAGNAKFDFQVNFHVEGNGSNRRLVAEQPILTRKY